MTQSHDQQSGSQGDRQAPERSRSPRKDRRFHPWGNLELEPRLLLSTFETLNIATIANADFESFYPRGSVILGGVPFDIPSSGNNGWDSQDSHYPGPNPHDVTIPVGVAGVSSVHTLMNTTWGTFGPNSSTSLEFFGSGGAYFRKDLIGGVDIRSYGSDRRYPNIAQTINGTTTVNVFTTPNPGAPGENWWLDKQAIDLPDEFSTQTLDTIHLSDTGADWFHRAFLYGVTVDTTPTPDLATASLAWNSAQGGVDFGYTISGANLTQPTTAVLYWSADTTFDPSQDTLIPGSVTTTQTAAGTYGPIHVDAATLGTPSAGAKYLLAVADPPDATHPKGFVDEGDANERNNVRLLRVHSLSEILDGAVVPSVEGRVTMAASFVPGRNSPEGPFTLTEAEVVLGVDHFNWVQTIQVPSNIKLQIWRGVTQRDPQSGRPLDGVLIATPSPAYDPVPNSGGDQYFFRVDGIRIGDVRYFRVDYPAADAAEPYLEEIPPQWSISTSYGGPASDHEFVFKDTPGIPSDFFLFTNSYITFTTRLVGIDRSSGNWHSFDRPRTGFTWKFNTYHGPTGVAYLTGRPTDAPPILGGGIFDVRFDDGASVPNTPTDAPPLPALVSPQSVTIAGGNRRRPVAKSVTIAFSGPLTIGAGAFELVNRRGRKNRPIALAVTTSSVDGKTLTVLRLAGRRRALTDGKYTLTIQGDTILDSLGRSLDGDADGVVGGDHVEQFRIVHGRHK